MADPVALTCDAKVVGDDIIIVRVCADATQEQADDLAARARALVAAHGLGHVVFVARAFPTTTRQPARNPGG
jgi:hypothetical protein